MEYIVIGIAIAIGFYIAPLVITILGATVLGIGVGICKLFGGCK